MNKARRRARWTWPLLVLLHAAASAACAPRPASSRGAPSSVGSAAPSAAAPPSGSPLAPAVGAPARPYDGSPAPCAHVGSGREFAVGPGRAFTRLGDVPFESLSAGDTVRIFWRAQPYREKLMISARGTAKDPVRVCGVPGPAGQLPVIDGEDATTRPQLDFPFDGHQVRGLVIIGHAHGGRWEDTPSHIVLEGLEIRNSAPPHAFTDRAGKRASYSPIAAGIFVERARHLTIRGCTVTANNNGVFIGTGGGAVTLTEDVLLEGNYVHGNGSLADYYEHNVYNEASGVTYQFNRFGPPRGGPSGPLGANIKERSAGVVIRYNWIEDGAHLLDLVDAQESKDETRALPSFHSTYVYGNVLVRGASPSGSMVHYGGDSEVFEDYRKGTLYFFHNTVLVRNEGYRDYTRTAVFELSTNDEHLDSRNNVYFSDREPDELHAIGMLGARDRISSGVATFAGDWVRKGWTPHDLTLGLEVELRAKVSGLDRVVRGDTPGFRDARSDDLALVGAGASVALAPEVREGPVFEYVKHQRGKVRTGPPRPGAF